MYRAVSLHRIVRGGGKGRKGEHPFRAAPSAKAAPAALCLAAIVPVSIEIEMARVG